MARCSAVINSSTGFSHVLIIGSGQCVLIFLLSNNQDQGVFHWFHFVPLLPFPPLWW